jgi:hypothetical protein
MKAANNGTGKAARKRGFPQHVKKASQSFAPAGAKEV